MIGVNMSSTKSDSQEEIIFKPKYPSRIMLTVFLYPIGIIACIFFIYLAFTTRRIFPYGLFALIFGFTTLSMPIILVRGIHFNKCITVKRYFLPSRKIQYQDVVKLTSHGLVAKRGGIPLANVQNRDEFEKIIRKLVNRNVIRLEKSKSGK
jgi:hypothetical protein